MSSPDFPDELPSIYNGAGKVTATTVVAAILGRFDFVRSTEGTLVSVPRDPSLPRIATEVDSLTATIARMVWDEAGTVATTAVTSAAAHALKAIADNAPTAPIPLRSFQDGPALWVDLARTDGQLVRIRPGQWELLPSRHPDAPVFRRTRLTRPLPLPTTGSSRLLLRGILSLDNDDHSWRLLWSWLVGSLFEATSRPVLWVSGPQGSGKTTRARTVKSVIDPGDIGPAPRDDERDATATAAGAFVPSWDNLTNVRGPFSDWLCQLVTGVEVTRRKLYTDADLYVQRLQRTGVATSIAMPLGLRPDALERLVAVDFERVTMAERRDDEGIAEAFTEAHPAVLGALFDDVAGVLANIRRARESGIPLVRMASFHSHLIALDLHVGNDPTDPSAFAGTYSGAVGDAVGDRAGNNPLVLAVLDFLRNKRRGSGYKWEGLPSELVPLLVDYAPSTGDEARFWPSGPAQLSMKLRQASEELRAMNVTMDRRRTGPQNNKRNLIVLTYNRPE